MSGSLYTESNITDLIDVRDQMIAYMKDNGPDAMWSEYEIRNRRHKRMPVIQAIRELDQIISAALVCKSVASGSARNRARYNS